MVWNSEKKLPEAEHPKVTSTSSSTPSCPIKATNTETEKEEKKEQ